MKAALKTIACLATLVWLFSFIGVFLWGFYLSLKIVGDLGGFWATLAGGLLYPVIYLVVPWYAGFARGDWLPFWVSYVLLWVPAVLGAVFARMWLKPEKLTERTSDSA